MTSASRQLLDYLASRVTVQDVRDFCPGDPGYAGYVEEFTMVLKTGRVPREASCEVTETIGLTRGLDPLQTSNPHRFCWFRLIVNAVGIIISVGPTGPGDELPGNYLAITLLRDAFALRDRALLRLLAPVLGELHARIDAEGWPKGEAPFLLVAQIGLALLGLAPGSDAVNLAAELRQKMDREPKWSWGATAYAAFHSSWQDFVHVTFRQAQAECFVSLHWDLFEGRRSGRDLDLFDLTAPIPWPGE